MQEVPLHFVLVGKQSWQRSRPGAVQEAGGEGPQLTQHKAGWVTALGKGSAQGVHPGANAPLSHTRRAVFTRLLLQLPVSCSFYPAQRAGAHSGFCHLFTRIQQHFHAQGQPAMLCVPHVTGIRGVLGWNRMRSRAPGLYQASRTRTVEFSA